MFWRATSEKEKKFCHLQCRYNSQHRKEDSIGGARKTKRGRQKRLGAHTNGDVLHLQRKGKNEEVGRVEKEGVSLGRSTRKEDGRRLAMEG